MKNIVTTIILTICMISSYSNSYAQTISTADRKQFKQEFTPQEFSNESYYVLYISNGKVYNIRGTEIDENGVFLITSPYIGNMLLPVPRTNDEARNFEAQWTSVKTENAKFCVANDKLALGQLTFKTADGKEYVYRIDASLTYRNQKINYNFDALDMNELAQGSGQKGGRIVNANVDIGKSDVDTNIPEAEQPNENLFAVIISNENYRRETKVQFANNDGEAFRKYCVTTLGCPEKNVHYVADATLNDMNAEIDWIRTVANAYNGQAKLIFYYSGHGVPDENTKSQTPTCSVAETLPDEEWRNWKLIVPAPVQEEETTGTPETPEAIN